MSSKSPPGGGVGYARANVSMPILLRKISGQVCRAKGYSGLSTYVQHYLRRDAAVLGIAPLGPLGQVAAMSHAKPMPELTSGLAG